MATHNTEIDLKAIKEQLPKESIGDDVILLEDVSKVPLFHHPVKINHAVATICTEGMAEGTINLKPYKFSKNDFFIVGPGQIVQFTSVSQDFKGLHIVMSERFINNLELSAKDTLSVFLHLKERNIMHLTDEDMPHLIEYYNILKKAVVRVENPRRIDIVKALTQAMFYGMNNFEQIKQNQNVQKTTKEVLFNSFYELLLQHYRDSREVGFYAEKLCLTPKYLSTSIKEATGKTAFEWINDYIILEIKTMLKSTNMTIQQISDELNFPNQSFLGKFFKQHVGVSPSKFRAE